MNRAIFLSVGYLRQTASMVSKLNGLELFWFSQCIPRHSFIFRLIMGKKLKTHDHMEPLDFLPNAGNVILRCSLSDQQRDSRDHLFFECQFSSQVWNKLSILLICN